jgi:hypothetical protein
MAQQQNQIFLTAPAVVLFKGTKVANASTATLSIRTNSSKTPSSDGLVVSTGFKMGDVTFGTLETVDGASSRFMRALFDNEIFQVVFVQGGQTITVDGTFDEASRTATYERGSTEGSYKMSGTVELL